MSDHVKGTPNSPNSAKALFLAATGLIYLYFTLSIRCLVSGLPLLVGLGVHWLMDSDNPIRESPRLLIWVFAFTNIAYWVFNSSYILYPIFSILVWTASLGISVYRYQVLRDCFEPFRRFVWSKLKTLEDKIAIYSWPLLDFDGQGILALSGTSLDISSMTLLIKGIDLSYALDENTKIVAKVGPVAVRLCRDISVAEIYINIVGDGNAPIESPRFKPVIRTDTVSSSASVSSANDSIDEAKATSLRALAPPHTSSVTSVDASIPPRLPPRLPPRNNPGISSTVNIDREEGRQEDEDVKLAMKHSLETSREYNPSIREHNPSSTTSAELVAPQDAQYPGTIPLENSTTRESLVSSRSRASSSTQMDDPNYFFPKDDAEGDAEMQRALDESAIHHTTTAGEAEQNKSDAKAAMAASLQDQVNQDIRNKTSEANGTNRIELHTIIEQVPWWMKVTPGPLLTRLLLAPAAWLHPVKFSSIACTATGKRITNSMELAGFKKAHANQEIFRLIRKVFNWLQAGDISIILADIILRVHVPVASDHDVRIDLKAQEPTVYRHTGGKEEILAKIDALVLSLEVPLFLMPNHERYIPKTPRHCMPMHINLSLPGVFNRELLTIGAAFIKAGTMLDLQKTAQARTAPPMPTSGQFSFKSFGLAVKQAAGDLAKQKGVQWGIRDTEIAKWVNKFAKLMRWVSVDVGGKIDLPIDVYRLRMNQQREAQKA